MVRVKGTIWTSENSGACEVTNINDSASEGLNLTVFQPQQPGRWVGRNYGQLERCCRHGAERARLILAVAAFSSIGAGIFV